jgi:hypothetical protein
MLVVVTTGRGAAVPVALRRIRTTRRAREDCMER